MLNSKEVMKNVTKCLSNPFSVDELNSLGLQVLVYMRKLFKTSGVDGLERADRELRYVIGSTSNPGIRKREIP